MSSKQAARSLAKQYGQKVFSIVAHAEHQTLKQMGNALWCRRIALGYTQREVAELACTSVSSYCRMENGCPVSTDVLLNVMAVLEMKLRFVPKGEGNEQA